MKSITKKSLVALGLLSLFSSAMAKEIVDIAGRTVEVPDTINRIALGEGRMMYSLAILESNPVKNVVGWRSDLIRNDPDTVKKLTATFPETAKIPDLGDPYTSDVNLESLINLKPDVYLLNVGNLIKAKETGLITKLDKAGIPVVFVDFRQHPIGDTIPSMLILGEVLNKQQKAMKFVNYYRQQLALVTNRLAKLKEQDKPSVFFENMPGVYPGECCVTWGPTNFGEFVALAGGKNYGSTVTSGFQAKVNPETVFSGNFDIIVGSGANWREHYDGVQSVSLGYYAKPDEVQAQLKFLADRKGWGTLKAVKDKRFYSIFHHFYNSPYHFIAVQAFAKWFHPELFKDVDVEKNFKDFHKEFLPFDYSGIFFTQLK